MEEAVYKVTPDAEGVLRFPVDPQPYIRIRLWTLGPPRAATDWWVIMGDFPAVAANDQIHAGQRGAIDARVSGIIARLGKQLSDFGTKGAVRHGLMMDIEVPQPLIDALEAR